MRLFVLKACFLSRKYVFVSFSNKIRGAIVLFAVHKHAVALEVSVETSTMCELRTDC